MGRFVSLILVLVFVASGFTLIVNSIPFNLGVCSELDITTEWRFDEGIGSVAYDSVGNNDGVIYGGRWTDGIFGKAIELDGSDDYIDGGNDLSLYPSEITIELWLKSHNPHVDSNVISVKTGYGENPNTLAIRDGVFVGTVFASGQSRKVTGTSTIIENSWYHIALTVGRSSFTLFVNGVPEDTDSGGNIQTTINTGNYNIGRMPAEGAYRYFDGVVDNIRIWNTPLSIEEIEDYYTACLAAIPSLISLDDAPDGSPIDDGKNSEMESADDGAKAADENTLEPESNNIDIKWFCGMFIGVVSFIFSVYNRYRPPTPKKR